MIIDKNAIKEQIKKWNDTKMNEEVLNNAINLVVRNYITILASEAVDEYEMDIDEISLEEKTK